MTCNYSLTATSTVVICVAGSACYVVCTRFSVLTVALGLSAPGKQLRYRAHLPSRFVVIPRHSRAKHQDVIFIDTDPFHVSGLPAP